MEFLSWLELNFGVVYAYKELFIRGFFMTIFLTASAVLMGTVLGLFLGLGKLSKKRLLNVPAKAYIELFRGTPLFVQILVIHFAAIPTIFEALNAQIPGPIFSGVVALTLNSGAYVAEIFRGGIESIDRGQMEAARSLGMTHGQAMWLVIIPQAFKRMLPPLGNEFIALLKDSSLLAFIAVNELTYAGFVSAKSTFIRWGPYITIAILYLILTLIFSKVVNYMERKLKTE